MADVDTLLAAREVTHGRFEDNADAFDRLLAACPLEGFDPRERYAISALYFKIARLYSGRMERQHWEDVAGYGAKMVELIEAAESIPETIRATPQASGIASYDGRVIIQGTLR